MYFPILAVIFIVYVCYFNERHIIFKRDYKWVEAILRSRELKYFIITMTAIFFISKDGGNDETKYLKIITLVLLYIIFDLCIIRNIADNDGGV